MPHDVGIGILGTGFAGRMHAQAARTLNTRLVGVVSSTPAHAEAAARALGAEHGFSTAAELIARPDIEVVHVCTPNDLHVPYVEMALAAGKHVICEKPLAATAAGAARLAGLAEASGLQAAICFTYRYQSMAQEAREKVRSGELGPVRLVHGTYLQDWLLYESDGNWRTQSAASGASRAFADIGSHWCDLAEWVSGHRITDLAAVTSRVFDKRAGAGGGAGSGDGELVSVDTEDIACLVFRATESVVGSLTVSQVSPGRKNRLWLEVDAAESSVVFDQENAEWLFLGSRAANRLIARDGAGTVSRFPASSALPPGHARGFLEAFAELFSQVYESARSGAPGEFPTFGDGLRSALITEAVLRSAGEQAWVRLP